MDEKKKETVEESAVLDGALLAKMATGGAAELRANADTVNNLNVFPVPDGDTGDNMRMTIENGVAALSKIKTNDLETVMSTLSRGMLLGARGNSGVILSQFFSGMAKGFEHCEKADAATIAHALELGVKKAYDSVLTPTEGTILTVARESVEYAVSRLTPDSTVNSLFADLAKEMSDSLQRTPELLAALKEAKVVDSGGAGLMYIINGFNKVLSGEEMPAISLTVGESAAAPAAVAASGFNENSEMEFGYCTEFLLQLQTKKTDIAAFDVSTVTDYLSTIGNSIVAFKDGSIVKVHVHTMTPEKALGFCRQFGEFLTVKIENMSVQHSETIPEEEKSKEPAKKYATVAVCSGEGLMNTFRELGVDQVISGGQTNNPSTQDFLDAFRKINAENIFVFPNNGNIIMAAKQAAEEYQRAKVFVIETKTLGAGYVGIAAIDDCAETPEEILSCIETAMQTVITASVSLAVRDADIGGKHIHNGDYMGFVGKEVLVLSEDRDDVARKLVDHILTTPDAFLLTVFYGKDVTDEAAGALEAYCREKYPDMEIYFINGGQEVYPYIMTSEVCG